MRIKPPLNFIRHRYHLYTRIHWLFQWLTSSSNSIYSKFISTAKNLRNTHTYVRISLSRYKHTSTYNRFCILKSHQSLKTKIGANAIQIFPISVKVSIYKRSRYPHSSYATAQQFQWPKLQIVPYISLDTVFNIHIKNSHYSDMSSFATT